MNTNPDFLIWGEHNGFLKQIASAYYGAAHPRFPDRLALGAEHRIKQLRDGRRWAAWDNLCGDAEFLERFRAFIRSLFADPTSQAARWGFKEIRYAQDAQDRTLQLMFDCFPEMRLIVLVREPAPTIFSMLSHWVFPDRRNGNIDLDELDQRILTLADSWNVQYMHLRSFLQVRPSACMAIRYEDLRNPHTYRKLSNFLEASSFDFGACLGKVKDASGKTDPTAVLVRQRIQFLDRRIAVATSNARAAYGYPEIAGPRARPVATKARRV